MKGRDDDQGAGDKGRNLIAQAVVGCTGKIDINFKKVVAMQSVIAGEGGNVCIWLEVNAVHTHGGVGGGFFLG